MLPRYFLVFSFLFSTFIYARVMIVVNHKHETCHEIPESERANSIDFSKLEFYPENDTHTFINGSVKFINELLKLPGKICSEKHIQGQWLVQGFNRQYTDLCTAALSVSEPFYLYTKNFPGCPQPKGFEWKFDMVPIVFSEYLLNAMPPHYMGNWRITFIAKFEIDGETKIECRRFYGDVYEV